MCFLALVIGAAVGAGQWFVLIPVVMFILFGLSKLKSEPSEPLDDHTVPIPYKAEGVDHH